MYIVIEIQTSSTVATIVTQHATRAEAESKYHTILAAAAISQVPKHGAILLSDEGFPLMNYCYKHEPEPEIVEEGE